MSKRHSLPAIALCAAVAVAGLASTDASARGFGGGFGGGRSVGGGFAGRSFGGGFANRSFVAHSFASRSVVSENVGRSHFGRSWHNPGSEGTHTAQNFHAVTHLPPLLPGPGTTGTPIQSVPPTGRTPIHIPVQVNPCLQNPTLCGLGTTPTPVNIPTKVNPCVINPTLCGLGTVTTPNPTPGPGPDRAWLGRPGVGPGPGLAAGPILTWKHHPHWWVDGYPVAIDGPVDPVVTVPVVGDPVAVVKQVAVTLPGPCACLTKQYLDDGSVLFGDICTRGARRWPPRTS